MKIYASNQYKNPPSPNSGSSHNPRTFREKNHSGSLYLPKRSAGNFCMHQITMYKKKTKLFQLNLKDQTKNKKEKLQKKIKKQTKKNNWATMSEKVN